MSIVITAGSGFNDNANGVDITYAGVYFIFILNKYLTGTSY